eukprot:15325770-Ditylum_brightwellii.AAC.1
MEKLKSKLKKIKLSNYPGENVWKINVDIKAQCDILDGTGYWEKDLLYVIIKKYKTSKCEKFCLWAISTISEKTIAYLRMSTLQDDTNIPAEAKVAYGSILKETTVKYEKLVCSTDWTPHVYEKEQTVEPDLPKGYKAAIEKTVSSSMNKFKQFNGEGRNKIPSVTHHKSGDGKAQCGHCDEKDHIKSGCPHKDKKWYEVTSKNNQYKGIHSTKEGTKPVTYCTTCGTWHYDSIQDHLA